MVGRDAEAADHEAVDRLVARARGADELDDLVDVADGVDQAFDAVGFLVRQAQAEGGAAADDRDAVLDVEADEVAQAQGLRLAVDQRDVHDAEGRLQRGEFVELVLDDNGV